MTTNRRKGGGRPLDGKSLDDLALRYVSRYATTRSKLRTYLKRKVAERGWSGDVEADFDGLVGRLDRLGYVDDRAFAIAKASAHQARGLGKRRLAQSLRAAGVGEDDQAPALDQSEEAALESALRFARRRRLGPFASEPVSDPRMRDRAMGAFIRAGHSFHLARRIVALDPDPQSDLQQLVEELSHTNE